MLENKDYQGDSLARRIAFSCDRHVQQLVGAIRLWILADVDAIDQPQAISSFDVQNSLKLWTTIREQARCIIKPLILQFLRYS
ncbi:hypothetical protein [Peribacillus sp. Bi96]|uniref:hypothetical protein n=1 Tax=Peribacillus sp. Bi96 TaxID=2884273 RepID=UPI001E2FE92A|nr:hypothetical protein [Peribacillus sp. Bi96]